MASQKQQKVRVFTTGRYQGKSVVLGGHRFDQGVATFVGTEDQLQPVLRKLARGWQAYPEGSAELRALYQHGSGGGHGERGDVQAAQGKRNSEPVLGDGQSGQQGAEEQAGSAGVGYAQADARQGRVLSGGDGHGDAGLPEQHSNGSEGRPDSSESVNPQLARVVRNLDPDNDQHWTKSGKPSLAAVTEGYGSGDVTRSDINRAAPGWDRDTARQKALEDI